MNKDQIAKYVCEWIERKRRSRKKLGRVNGILREKTRNYKFNHKKKMHELIYRYDGNKDGL